MIAFVAVSSLMVFYGSRLSELRADQELRANVGTVLKGFSTAASCNRQLTALLGAFPAKITVLDRDFATVEYNNEKIPTSGPFPGQPFGRVRRVRLRLEGVPLPSQKVLRGRIHVEYDRINTTGAPTRLRSRSQSVFFALNEDGNVTRCLDEKGYKHVEYAEQACRKLGGHFEVGFTCNVANAVITRRVACKAMGMDFSGDTCVPCSGSSCAP